MRALGGALLPVTSLRLFASARSAGKTIEWNGHDITVEDAETADYSARYCARGSTSKELAPRAKAAGAIVIDNPVPGAWTTTSATPGGRRRPPLDPQGHRRQPQLHHDGRHPVMKPLADEAGLEAMIISTYQAVSVPDSVFASLMSRPRRSAPTVRSSPRRAACRSTRARTS